MKKTTILAALIVASAAAHAAGSNWVNGHTRSDGTYVEGHYRTSPNGSKLDNYSTQGNYNPYTGQQGTVDPFRTQQCGTNSRGQYICR
ncbi:MAG: hypothetical protein ORN28_06010 [Rhodoferax sp.]|nr:hypothetical protein [Rhodoferax sp.]